MASFGSANNPTSNAGGGSLFGNANQSNATSSQPSSNLFGQPASSSNAFGSSTTSTSGTGSLFGTAQSSQPTSNSLFSRIGTPQSTQPSTGSTLFGGTAGSSAQTSAPSAPSLFGGLGGANSSSQPPTGSLFSSTSQNTSQPQQSSLFSGAGQSNTQPQAGNSLFSRIGAPASQPQPTGGSLFGGNTQGAGTGLTARFAPSQNNQQESQQAGQVVKNSTTTEPALFDDLLARGKKRRDHGDNGSVISSGTLPSLQLGLGDISSKIKGLGSTKPDFSASRAVDSRAQYLLAASGVPQGATRKDLLAFESDINGNAAAIPPEQDPRIENYVASIHAKTTREIMEEANEQWKRDFDNFLEDNLQIDWDYQRRRAYEFLGLAKPNEEENSGTQANSSARGAFGQSSRRNRGLDATGKGSLRGSLRASGMSKSVLGGSIARGSTRHNLFKDVDEKAGENGVSPAADNPFKRTKQERYMAKVRELNHARIEDIVYPVVEQFARVELEGGSDTPPEMIEAYRALKSIVGERSDVERPSDEGAIRERQYREDYLNDNPNASSSIQMRRQILQGSLKFLEGNFFSKVENLVDRNPQEANIGGMPTKASKVRGYLRIREAGKDLLDEDQEPQRGEDGEPIWAMIYFLIRSGLIDEAAKYVQDNERVVKTYDRSFPQYIEAYASQNRDIPYSLRSRMVREYQQRLNNPGKVNDPYRMACYRVMGRCDLGKPRLDVPRVGPEDLMWLYFALARESNRAEETAGETYGLAEVQNMILEIKERHLGPNSESGLGYGMGVFLLVLGGLFEDAISYLYAYDYVAAVHFAIATDFYGLLRVADFNTSANELLTYSTREKPQISFGYMLGYYTRDFRLARAEAAADYIILMCLNEDLQGEAGRQHVDTCHEALKELVLETREFALLLGDIRTDGRRIKGVIEERLPLFAKNIHDQQTFLRSLTIQAASQADDAGRITDAVLLYHLAEEYDNVIGVINRALSDALSVDLGSEPFRLQPLKPRAPPEEQQQQTQITDTSSLSLTSVDSPVVLAENMLSLYNQHALYFSKVSQPNRDAAATLMRMSEVRDRIAASRWAEAIDTILLMDVLPMRTNGDINAIRSYSQNLNEQPPVVARNIGNLLIWAIGACGEQRRVLRQGGWDIANRGREAEEELKATAKDLMVFGGLIRYRVAGDVYEMLARAGQDVEML